MNGSDQRRTRQTPHGLEPGVLSAVLQELAEIPDGPSDVGWSGWLVPGLVVGRFELVREVGHGGFGVVWEARDRDLRRNVAFKAIRAGRKAALREERLLREAEAAARLSHPNLVTLFDGRSRRRDPRARSPKRIVTDSRRVRVFRPKRAARPAGAPMKTPYAACLSLLLVNGSGCATHLTTVERNKEVARRAFSEVLEKGRFEVVGDLYAADFRNGTATLAEDMAALRTWHSVLPSDATMRPDLVLGEGEYVTVLWTARATVKGRPLKGGGITIWRFENGKIREEWSQFDQERWMRELGLESLGGAEPKR